MCVRVCMCVRAHHLTSGDGQWTFPLDWTLSGRRRWAREVCCPSASFTDPQILFIPEISTWLVDNGLNFVSDLASAEVTELSRRVRRRGAADSKLDWECLREMGKKRGQGGWWAQHTHPLSDFLLALLLWGHEHLDPGRTSRIKDPLPGLFGTL